MFRTCIDGSGENLDCIIELGKSESVLSVSYDFAKGQGLTLAEVSGVSISEEASDASVIQRNRRGRVGHTPTRGSTSTKPGNEVWVVSKDPSAGASRLSTQSIVAIAYGVVYLY